MTRIRRVNRRTAGISTIIAAALLVAMTVIAAVALGATVLQVPTEQQKPPQLQMSGTASISKHEIRLTHLGGDTINTGAITIKTIIPNGAYEDIVNTVPNPIPNYDSMAFLMATSPPYTLPMRLETDTYGYMWSWNYMGGDYPFYGYHYLSNSTGLYAAPIQAGDTLILDFDQSFGSLSVSGSSGKLAAPAAGEQFIVELFSGTQPITAITIVVQP
jgi:hypothetical protein